MINKILLINNKKFYWKQGDLHTEYGFVKEDIIQKTKPGCFVETNKGIKLLVLSANINDNFERIKRGPAIMIKKDIGYILTNANLNKTSVVVEAGSGSGALTIFLALFCKKVISYEERKDFLDIAKKNVESFNLKNVLFRNKNIKDLKENQVDAVILDILEPENVLVNIHKSLEPGNYLVCYITNIPKVQILINKAKNLFYYEKTIEISERSWLIDELRARPDSQMLGHTGFLVFLRRI